MSKDHQYIMRIVMRRFLGSAFVAFTMLCSGGFMDTAYATGTLLHNGPGREDREDRGDRDRDRDRDRDGDRDRDRESDRDSRMDKDAIRAARDAERLRQDELEIQEKLNDELSDSSMDKSSSGSGSNENIDNSGSGSANSGSGSDNSGSGSNNSGSGSSNSGPGNNNDDDDDDDDGASYGSSAILTDYDNEGHSFRANEYVLVSDDANVADRVRAAGFNIVEENGLDRLGLVTLRVTRPEGSQRQDGLELLQSISPESAAGYNHYYRPASYTQSEVTTQPTIQSPTPVSSVAASIGVVDAFSAAIHDNRPVQSFVKSPSTDPHGDYVTNVLTSDLRSYYGLSVKDLLLANVVEALPGGDRAASLDSIIKALDWLAVGRVEIINMSLAGPDNPVLARAITRLSEQGIKIVAAAGNVGPAAPMQYPAGYSQTIAVTAVDAEGKAYLYAPRGSHIDFSAVAVSLVDTNSGIELSGTSFAAPRVSAALAAMKRETSSVPKEELLAREAHDLGEAGKDPIFGYGVVGPYSEQR